MMSATNCEKGRLAVSVGSSCRDHNLAGSELFIFVYPIVVAGAFFPSPPEKAVSSCANGLPDSGQESYSASNSDVVGNGSISTSAKAAGAAQGEAG